MTAPHTKTVIIVCGPTAVGKTALAIRLAQHFKTEIISADSRQCFKELAIGVARPSESELKTVPHHFIATHSVEQDVNAASFEQYALEKANQIFEKHKLLIMVGGTGLYIRAFCEGLDQIPEIPQGLRDNIILNYQQKGLQWLQEQIAVKDPAFYKEGEIQNPQRLMRALEVKEATGKSILSFRKGEKQQRNFQIIKIGLELPREQLNQQIHHRVDQMMEQGLLDEVKNLIAYRHLNALQTVGYSELFDFLDGKIELKTAVEQIKTHTRQYAKRQMTWFKKDNTIHWFAPDELEKILKLVVEHCEKKNET